MLSVLCTTHTLVQTTWNFLNLSAHLHHLLLSHGKAHLEQLHGARHHLQLSLH
jgi:hypothetical protein